MAGVIVSGVKATMDAFKAADFAVKQKAIKKANKAIAKMVKKAIKDKTPKVTGSLNRSIGVIFKKTKNGMQYAVVGVMNRYQDKKSGKIPNFYATQVEFGGMLTKGKPTSFIRAGANSVRSLVPQIYAGAIRDALKRLTK